MTPRDSTEAALLLLGAFFALMLAICALEWLLIEIPRAWRVRRWQRRLRDHESRVDRSRYALRSTVRPLRGPRYIGRGFMESCRLAGCVGGNLCKQPGCNQGIEL